MAHIHPMYDTDQHFKIDPLTMQINTDAAIKPLRKGEHLAEIKTFEMPRYLDGHDMLLCNKVEVHYNNINVNTATRTTTEVKSFDQIEDFAIDPEDENTVIWSWHIAGDAAQNSGNTSFCFRFACLEGEVITYQKFTEIYAAIPVNDTIYNTEQLAFEQADALERWKLEVIAECGGTVSDEQIATAVTKYLEENPVDASGLEVAGTVGQLIRIAAVDESGKPTAWEAVDMPEALTDEEYAALAELLETEV